MYRIGAIIGLLLAATAGAAQADTCKLTQVASLDLTIGPDGGALVPVIIQGTTQYFELGLSVQHSGITQKLADDLKLTAQPLPSKVRVGYMGQKVTSTVAVTAFKLGAATGSTEAFVMPRFDLHPMAAGVLGLDVLRTFDLELDLSAKKLNLFAKDHCPDQVVYWTHTSSAALGMTVATLGNFTVPMQLDGKDIRVGFDSMTPYSTMRMNAAADIFNITEVSPGVVPADAALPPGFGAVRRYPFKSLAGDGIAIGDPEIYLFGDYSPRHHICDGEQHFADLAASMAYRCFGGEAQIELGLDTMRHLHMFFDFSESTLYFTAADAH